MLQRVTLLADEATQMCFSLKQAVQGRLLCFDAQPRRWKHSQAFLLPRPQAALQGCKTVSCGDEADPNFVDMLPRVSGTPFKQL